MVCHMPSSYVRLLLLLLLLIYVGSGTETLLSDVIDGIEMDGIKAVVVEENSVVDQLGANSEAEEVVEEVVTDAVDTGSVQVYACDKIVDGANELVGDVLDDVEAVVAVGAANVGDMLDDVEMVDVDDMLDVELVDGV